MSGIRKWLCLFFGVALAAFALPGVAQTIKTFTITPPQSVNVGTQLIQVTFTNTGNSNFNAFELDITSNNLQFNTAVSPTLSQGFSGTVSIFNSTKLQFTNTTPVKNKPVTVTVSVIATNNSCAAGVGTWSGGAWTGSPSQPSQTFLLTPAPGNTAINSSCNMTFSTQPVSSALSGGLLGSAQNPVTVQVTPAAVFQGQSITLSVASGPAGATLTPQNNPATYGPVAVDANGFAAFPGLVLNGSSGNYKLGASTGVAGYPTATSSLIAITVGLGPLDCSDLFATDDGSLSGERGKYNKDGVTNCVKVPYVVSGPSAGNNSTSFKWDTISQPLATFKYTIIWQPVGVDTDGFTAIQPLVAWESDKYGVVGQVFVPSLACLAPDLPQPYGVVVTDAGSTVTVDTATGVVALPMSGSFPIVIGTERMQATVQSGVVGQPTQFVLGVSRPTGGTTQVGHNPLDPVMTTPLPIDPNLNISDSESPLNGQANPYYHKQAHMCIVSHVWTVDSGGQIHYQTIVIDIGDGGVKLP
jgi:hypothetical protein